MYMEEIWRKIRENKFIFDWILFVLHRSKPRILELFVLQKYFGIFFCFFTQKCLLEWFFFLILVPSLTSSNTWTLFKGNCLKWLYGFRRIFVFAYCSLKGMGWKTNGLKDNDIILGFFISLEMFECK